LKMRRSCTRLLLAEDTYGVEFHKAILNKLGLDPRPSVRRLPAKKCNPKIYKAIMGRVIGSASWRVLAVIDQESHPTPVAAAQSDFCVHIRRHKERFDVAVATPRHEAWLCTGLTGKVTECNSRPEDVLSKLLGRPYKKRDLARQAQRVELQYLMGRRDFREYVRKLEWLVEC